MPVCRAVLFDLDGTLLDTLKDLAVSVNEAMTRCGWPAHPESSYRRFVGDGVRKLIERAAPAGAHGSAAFERAVEEYRAIYARRWDETTHPFPGIPECLAALAARRVPMGVLSNKPDEMTRKCVARYFPGIRFSYVAGQREGVPHKPDPAAAREAARVFAVPPSEVAMLGDSDVDMRMARAAGMFAAGACWGFRGADELRSAGAQALLSDPLELLKLVAGRVEPGA